MTDGTDGSLSVNDADGTADAELIRAQALLAAVQFKSPPKRKGWCGITMLVLLFAFLGLILYLGLWYEPAPQSYTPTSTADTDLASIGGGYGIALPKGWSRIPGGGYRFRGAHGAVLQVNHGTLNSLGIEMRDYHGNSIDGVYTPQSYIRGLRDRVARGKTVEQELAADRLRIGRLEGAEARLLLENGTVERGCAVVLPTPGYKLSRVIELHFTFPKGGETPDWQSADAILGSLYPLPKKTPKPTSPASTPSTGATTDTTPPPTERKPAQDTPAPIDR